jgi:hypothetical protein
MPIRPDSPLRRVTLNLYASDCEWFAANYGHGWAERIRQHLHNEVLKRKQPKVRTLGDLTDD